jgi:hypothetical protein
MNREVASLVMVQSSIFKLFLSFCGKLKLEL